MYLFEMLTDIYLTLMYLPIFRYSTRTYLFFVEKVKKKNILLLFTLNSYFKMYLLVKLLTVSLMDLVGMEFYSNCSNPI